MRKPERPIIRRIFPLATVGAALFISGALSSCGYHLGHPPLSNGIHLGSVSAPVAEPALPESLQESLARAVRRHGATGDREVRVLVIEASYKPAMGAEGIITAWNAALSVEFTMLGAEPRVLLLERSLTAPAPGEGSAHHAAARAQAFRELGDRIANEAVLALLFSQDVPK